MKTFYERFEAIMAEIRKTADFKACSHMTANFGAGKINYYCASDKPREFAELINNKFKLTVYNDGIGFNFTADNTTLEDFRTISIDAFLQHFENIIEASKEIIEVNGRKYKLITE